MKTSEIITAIIAMYGAVLSTVAIVRQFVSDRAKVKLTVRRNMQITGSMIYHGKTLTILRVTNIGRRPLTITTMGATGLYPHNSLVAGDCRPQLPCELTEGKYVTSYMNQHEIDFSMIDYWEASDSHDRVHKIQEASWFKHWKSRYQFKRSFRKKQARDKSIS